MLLHKINLLTHLYLECVCSYCGTASELKKHLFLGEAKQEDAHSKSFPSAFQLWKNAQSTGWASSTPLKTHTVSTVNFWHQLFCFTCVLPLCCIICAGNDHFWLVVWYQHQHYMKSWSWNFLYCCVKIREFPYSLHFVATIPKEKNVGKSRQFLVCLHHQTVS